MGVSSGTILTPLVIMAFAFGLYWTREGHKIASRLDAIKGKDMSHHLRLFRVYYVFKNPLPKDNLCAKSVLILRISFAGMVACLFATLIFLVYYS